MYPRHLGRRAHLRQDGRDAKGPELAIEAGSRKTPSSSLSSLWARKRSPTSAWRRSMSSTGRAPGHLNPVCKPLSGAAGVVGFGPAEAVGAVDVELAEVAERAEAVAAAADNQSFRGTAISPPSSAGFAFVGAVAFPSHTTAARWGA